MTSHFHQTTRDSVVIRIAGDSGDGMQLTGQQLATAMALWGNDVHTLPDSPAEIRAPAGTLGGVSGFQLHAAQDTIFTPGDKLDILVAMNPAALQKNKNDLQQGGLLVVNEDAFTEKEWQKAGFTTNPLKDSTCRQWSLIAITMTTYTLRALEGHTLSHSQAKKCKNMFALGVLTWLLDKSIQWNEQWLAKKFKTKPAIAESTIAALKAGYSFAEASELISERFHVAQGALPAGEYRQITGNDALGFACVAAATFASRDVFLAGYPITPASTLLHTVAKQQGFGIKTFQAEDEIAAISAAIGAAFAGNIAITCTSGPGFDLKSEAMGLGVMAELPLVIINVQRAGPSTGLPTKPEQSDLLAALYGRHGEAPLVVLAPATPSDNYRCLLEAIVLSQRYMTPVVLLSDAYLAVGAEPWCISHVHNDALLDTLKNPLIHEARSWHVPGEAGHEHCLGGLEKDKQTGFVSYDADNHEAMVIYRQQKIASVADSYEPCEIYGAKTGKVLVLGWGSTYGAIRSAVMQLHREGKSIAHVHLRHLNPLPHDLNTLLAAYEKVIIPEMNQGQLSQVIQQRYLRPVITINKVQGKPFLVNELITALEAHCES